MDPTEEYIEQKKKNFIYSETLFQASAVSGGNSVAMANWNDRGAKYIWIKTINVSLVSVLAAPIATIVDSYNRIVLQFNIQAEFSGQYIVNHIIESGVLLLTCNNNSVTFTAGYQFLSISDKKIEAKK